MPIRFKVMPLLKSLSQSFLKDKAVLEMSSSLFGLSALVCLSGAIYKTDFIQFILYGNHGNPSAWRSSFLFFSFVLVGWIALVLHTQLKKIDNPRPKEPPVQHTLSCNAFIPSLLQHLTVKVCIEVPKAEQDSDKINQVEAAIKAAITKMAATAPPQTERHAIHPLLETAIQNAAKSGSSFSYIQTHIIALEFPLHKPDDSAKARASGFVGWE